MASAEQQSLANHKRIVPYFHYLGGGLMLAYLVVAFVRLGRQLDLDSIGGVLVALILAVLGWYVRIFPLVVQDRVIRLEERLRLARLLPSELQPQIDQFTRGQLAALRFASDSELPGLVRTVIAEKLTTRMAIKERIKEWRPDHLRA
jgi:Family of unknown function (DUF6526)